MASLTTHLRQAGNHGHLPFRADCPVCCEQRLSGTLDDGPLVSRRAQASLAAALLAVSSVGPIPAAAAANPDRARAADVPAGEEVDPNFDPGGNDPLDDPVSPPGGIAPGAGGEDDDTTGAPVDSEPVQDPYIDQLTEPLEGEGGPVLRAPAGGPPPAPAPPPPPVAAPVPLLPTAQEAPVPEPAPKPAPKKLREDSERPGDRPGRRDRSGDRPSTTQVAPPPVPATAPLAVSPPPAEESSGANASQAQPRPARQHDSADSSLHVVQPGESLWSIASDQLGPRATVAAIAREVNRLWELNEQRIATGDPDLLMVGTVLRMR